MQNVPMQERGGSGYTAVVEFEPLPLNIERIYARHTTVLEAKEWIEERQQERLEEFRRGDVLANGMAPTVVASYFDGEWI